MCVILLLILLIIILILILMANDNVCNIIISINNIMCVMCVCNINGNNV